MCRGNEGLFIHTGYKRGLFAARSPQAVLEETKLHTFTPGLERAQESVSCSPKSTEELRQFIEGCDRPHPLMWISHEKTIKAVRQGLPKRRRGTWK